MNLSLYSNSICLTSKIWLKFDHTYQAHNLLRLCALNHRLNFETLPIREYLLFSSTLVQDQATTLKHLVLAQLVHSYLELFSFLQVSLVCGPLKRVLFWLFTSFQMKKELLYYLQHWRRKAFYYQKTQNILLSRINCSRT